jgi:2-(1,2-epoxy-1,2-dihydrophenyl)acetyl-CoA isomerase
MESRFVSFEIAEGVARITLNRPEVLNSFNAPMARELQARLDDCAAEAVRAVLLTGSGRAFCAGQDLAEVDPRRGVPIDIGTIIEENYNPIIRRLRRLEKPVVCAVNGVAAGAGANLALACDLVLASKQATFIQAFSGIGLIPDCGGTFFLPRRVGWARAAAMIYLAERVSAEQALAMGLIYKVCEPESLLEEAAALARHLATRPTKALGLAKRALERSASNDLDTQLDLERDLQREAGRTRDFEEAVRAFLEKREPKFVGH